MSGKDFEKAYRRLFLPLCMYALRITGDTSLAQDAVQQAVEAVWLRTADGFEPQDLRAYLYIAVRNEATHLSDGESRFTPLDADTTAVTDEQIDTSERDARIWKAIGSLSPRCREVFLLCKRDGLSNAQIAEKMAISVKTVENQMTKAYAALRQDLKRSLPDVLYMFSFFV